MIRLKPLEFDLKKKHIKKIYPIRQMKIIYLSNLFVLMYVENYHI